ncbi:hypothetical protein GCM10009761_00060 [Agromyces terreus]
MRLERDGVARTVEDRAARFDADAEARVLLLHAGRALLAEDETGEAGEAGASPALDLRSPAAVRDRLGADRVLVRCYLGRDASDEADAAASASAFAIEAWVLDDQGAEQIEPEPSRWAGLRQAATQLSGYEAALLTQAVAIANWHAVSQFCPRCGSATEPAESGWSRRCKADGGSLFPRTDPAVIVLVTDAEDRVLLGSNALWETNRFSLLAGFVEPGESLEHAVVREIGEEAGLVVDDVQYAGSQPWPFPASLMLGFTARAASTLPAPEVTPDGVEILELRWFSRAELAAALPEIGFPGRTSIAGWLLERWFGAPIESSPRGWGA